MCSRIRLVEGLLAMTALTMEAGCAPSVPAILTARPTEPVRATDAAVAAPTPADSDAGRRSQMVGGVEWIYYAAGETAEFENESVTLNSFRVEGDRLIASLTLLNGSPDRVLDVPGMFEAYQDTEEGLMAREEAPANCAGQFTVSDVIGPGESLTRNLCWKGVASDRFEIIFRPTGRSAGKQAAIFQFGQ